MEPPAPQNRGGTPEFRSLLDAAEERLKQNAPQWRRLSREQAAALYGAARLSPLYGEPTPAPSDGGADALSPS